MLLCNGRIWKDKIIFNVTVQWENVEGQGYLQCYCAMGECGRLSSMLLCNGRMLKVIFYVTLQWENVEGYLQCYCAMGEC